MMRSYPFSFLAHTQTNTHTHTHTQSSLCLGSTGRRGTAVPEMLPRCSHHVDTRDSGIESTLGVAAILEGLACKTARCFPSVGR